MFNEILVLLVDDHDIVRAAIQKILADHPNIKVIAEACTGKEAINLMDSLQPDVILMDCIMPDMSGLDAANLIFAKNQKPKILMVSSIHLDEFLLSRLLQSNIKGFLDKNSSADEMFKAIVS